MDLYLPPKPAIIRPHLHELRQDWRSRVRQPKEAALQVNQLTGFGAIVPPIYTPASITLNGTDEILSLVLSTSSPNNLLWTYSLWYKGAPGANQFTRLILSRADASNSTAVFGVGSSGFTPNACLAFQQTLTGAVSEAENSDVNSFSIDSTWHHYVIRYDSANGTADNRLIIEKDGSAINDTNTSAIGASESSNMLTNGRTMCICSHPTLFDGFASKVAFVEFVEGQSLASSNFGFSNSGTWTRKKYAGSYGSYGFLMDGSTGVIGTDLSGNGQTFTGTNMDASNLNTTDLPPYTN